MSVGHSTTETSGNSTVLELAARHSASAATVADRRIGPRCGQSYWASLLTLDGQEVIRCRPDNLGEGGMHLTAPVGYGFAVGQRYELLVGERDEAGAERRVVGEGHYATVVRTELLVEASGGQVGVGLRFDQPLVL